MRRLWSRYRRIRIFGSILTLLADPTKSRLIHRWQLIWGAAAFVKSSDYQRKISIRTKEWLPNVGKPLWTYQCQCSPVSTTLRFRGQELGIAVTRPPRQICWLEGCKKWEMLGISIYHTTSRHQLSDWSENAECGNSVEQTDCCWSLRTAIWKS